MTQTATEGPVQLLTARRRNPNRTYRTERLYRCANGLALGAVRDGVLTLGDDESPWEIFPFDQRGIAYGDSVGWVTDATLATAVTRLAAWPTP